MQTNSVQQRNLGFGVSREHLLGAAGMLERDGIAELTVRGSRCGKNLITALSANEPLTQGGKPLVHIMPLEEKALKADTVIFSNGKATESGAGKESLIDKALNGLAKMMNYTENVFDRNMSVSSGPNIAKHK